MIGSFAFTKGGQQTVTLSDNTTKVVSVLTVGANNVYAFVGTGGPYWVTAPGGTIQAPTSSTAVGVALANLSFGLALLKANDGSASYYALKATAQSISLVGVSGVTLAATSLSIDINASSGSPTSPVVNFAVSDPASGGNPAGLAVATGPSSSIDLNDISYSLEASGTVTLQVAFGGQAAISLGATVTFEDTTDSTGTQIMELAPDEPGRVVRLAGAVQHQWGEWALRHHRFGHGR